MGHHRCVVSDEAWAWLAPQLPSSAGHRGGRWRDHRQVIEAIAWKYRTGSPWRDLPTEFGSWKGAYTRLGRWSIDGTWQRLQGVFVARDPGIAAPARDPRDDPAPGRSEGPSATAWQRRRAPAGVRQGR